MPVYHYEPKEECTGCDFCRDGFDYTQSIKDDKLTQCPECGCAIVKTPVAAAIARSQSGFDDRAKAAGFSQLKKIGNGEYEKQY
jgi:predicted nucleic acid-binding Zn ribbon protein